MPLDYDMLHLHKQSSLSREDGSVDSKTASLPQHVFALLVEPGIVASGSLGILLLQNPDTYRIIGLRVQGTQGLKPKWCGKSCLQVCGGVRLQGLTGLWG